MKKPIAHSLVFALLSLFTASSTYAWGGLGHRITAQIAEPLLTHEARDRIAQLLHNEPLTAAATYMDTEREALQQRWPESPRWHYDNRPVCPAYNDAYCTDRHCATAQIERLRQILADRNAPADDRALALRLLIHIVGDLHQPVHMADNRDRGGNDTYLRLRPGAPRMRLHEVLDTTLLKQLIGTRRDREYANSLSRQYSAQLKSWSKGTVSNWADETHQLAVKEVYGRLSNFACGARLPRTVQLSDDFITAAQRYIPEQLTKAGVRIAALLNDTLR